MAKPKNETLTDALSSVEDADAVKQPSVDNPPDNPSVVNPPAVVVALDPENPGIQAMITAFNTFTKVPGVSVDRGTVKVTGENKIVNHFKVEGMDGLRFKVTVEADAYKLRGPKK